MSDLHSIVTDALDALRDERQRTAARLDAIDLAIDNLAHITGPSGRGKTASGGPKVIAADRRDELLAVIKAAKSGIGLGELRKQTPHMDGKARSNALQQLKVQGAIRRVRKVWKES